MSISGHHTYFNERAFRRNVSEVLAKPPKVEESLGGRAVSWIKGVGTFVGRVLLLGGRIISLIPRLYDKEPEALNIGFDLCKSTVSRIGFSVKRAVLSIGYQATGNHKELQRLELEDLADDAKEAIIERNSASFSQEQAIGLFAKYNEAGIRVPKWVMDAFFSCPRDPVAPVLEIIKNGQDTDGRLANRVKGLLIYRETGLDINKGRVTSDQMAKAESEYNEIMAKYEADSSQFSGVTSSHLYRKSDSGAIQWKVSVLLGERIDESRKLGPCLELLSSNSEPQVAKVVENAVKGDIYAGKYCGCYTPGHEHALVIDQEYTDLLAAYKINPGAFANLTLQDLKKPSIDGIPAWKQLSSLNGEHIRHVQQSKEKAIVLVQASEKMKVASEHERYPLELALQAKEKGVISQEEFNGYQESRYEAIVPEVNKKMLKAYEFELRVEYNQMVSHGTPSLLLAAFAKENQQLSPQEYDYYAKLMEDPKANKNELMRLNTIILEALRPQLKDEYNLLRSSPETPSVVLADHARKNQILTQYQYDCYVKASQEAAKEALKIMNRIILDGLAATLGRDQ